MCIRSFPLKGRLKYFNDEVTWMRRRILLNNLVSLEKELFVRMVETLLNRTDGHLVTNDELSRPRVEDIEKKVLSHRKAGKEGPTSNVITCSFTSVLFEVQIRVHGEKLEDNVNGLIDTLPKIISEDAKIRLTFDHV